MPGEGTRNEAIWWKLVEDLVTNFNEFRTQIFSPSDLMYYDESILRCSGQGGHWCCTLALNVRSYTDVIHIYGKDY